MDAVDGGSRYRYTALVDADSGEGVIVDNFAKRYAAMCRRVKAWAKVVDRYSQHYPVSMRMISLTYAKIEDFDTGHIRAYMKRLKRRLGGRLLAWAWVGELQKRGAMHYHIVVVVTPYTRVPFPDKSGMWKFGISSIVRARSPYYLVKYVGKEYQKDFSRYPRGAHAYACSVRMGPGYEILLRGLSQAKYQRDRKWQYRGSAVTESYARNVLLNK
jgi:hypothetical protein